MKRAPDPIPKPNPWKGTSYEEWAEGASTGTLLEVDLLDRCIEEKADDLINALERAKKYPAKGDTLRVEDVRALVYSVCVNRTRFRKEPLTEGHLRLLAAALEFRKLPSRAANYLGFPPLEPGHLEKFLNAADLQARTPSSSISQLAKTAGVTRATIRNWKKGEKFKGHFEHRYRATRIREDNPTEEDRAILEERRRLARQLIEETRVREDLGAQGCSTLYTESAKQQ
jgi:hypothetical protein